MDTAQVKDELAKGLRAFKAFENAQEVLTKLEGLEQLFKETEARVKVIQDSEAAWTGKKLQALSAAEAAQKNAAEIVSAAKKQASEVAEDARTTAAKIVNEAKDEAKSLKDAAQSDLDVLAEKSSDLKTTNSGLEAEIKARKLELEQVEATINQHKSELGRFLKG